MRRGQRTHKQRPENAQDEAGNSCEQSAIHSRGASGGSGGCAASTPQLNDERSAIHSPRGREADPHNERRRIHFAAAEDASGGSGGCAASTPQLDVSFPSSGAPPPGEPRGEAWPAALRAAATDEARRAARVARVPAGGLRRLRAPAPSGPRRGPRLRSRRPDVRAHPRPDPAAGRPEFFDSVGLGLRLPRT